MKKLLTILLILTTSFAQAQTATVYTTATVDTLLARQQRFFTAQITVLQNQLNQQQTAINTNQAITTARFTGIDTTLAKIRQTWLNPLDFIVISGQVVDSVNLRNKLILK